MLDMPGNFLKKHAGTLMTPRYRQPESSQNVNDLLITPDISSIINEIIGLPGWALGNSMGIMFGATNQARTPCLFLCKRTAI